MNELKPILISTVVKMIIRRCGEDTDQRHSETGEYYSLRSAERRLGISRTALSKIADGTTKQPDAGTFQKISMFLKSLKPPLEVDGEPFEPDWIDLLKMDALAKPKKKKKEKGKDEAEDKKAAILSQIQELMEELKKV